MSFATGLKTIVVATDLNGQSEAALEYARKLAANYGARIVLAHGLDPLEYADVETVPGQLRTGLPEGARAVLDKLAADLLREGIHSHSEIRQGTVAQMLVDVARQYEAGLIVVGTKGMQGAGPVVVGVIAEQLVRLAPCPVLAVAADWNAGEFRPTPGGPVMLAMERNEATATAVAAAYSLAGIFKRPLLVVHARDGAKQAAEKGLFPKEKCEKHASGPEGHIHFMPLIPGINPRPTARRSFSAAFKATVNPCADALEEFGLETSEEQPVRCMVKAGTPAEAMAEAIAEFHPCILVAGVKRTSETPGPHGTAFALLACSRVPVLCVPPEGATRRREREIADPVEAV